MSGVKILYVEDDEFMIEYVKTLFKKAQHQNIMYANGGTEALELYAKHQFDLVITDMVMPDLDGFQLIQKIREIHADQIFIVATALEDKNDLIKAIKLRVNFFIEKPIRFGEFKNVLDAAIGLIDEKKQLQLSSALINQYKKAVDTSAMVSKTDIDGVITYVNEEFCRVSKYTEDELIGKTHRVVRHPDMPHAVFRDLWRRLENKKSWKGIIKNQAKDGSAYYVDSLIMPILDADDNIMEYIAIRYDVTELEEYQDDLKKKLDEATKEIVETQKEVVYKMGAISETRSKETGNHVKRVAEYSYLLAKLAGLSEKDAELLKLASPMHDIGKVGIPDYILNKPGKLTHEEFEIMKTHAQIGYEMFKDSDREILKASAIVAIGHHEKWNGQGYPNALAGDDIHIFGRITAICDIFDALGSERCYKKAWELEKILEMFEKEKGVHFDPNLMDLFFENLDKFLVIRDKYVD